jgi:uncharacterized protein YbaP (TraB family)
MRRQIIVIFSSLFWLALAPAWAADRGALFKVSASGHTMYLFGTMHVGLPEFYPLEPRIAAAVAGASTLALEVDLARAPAEVARAMQEHGLRAPGTDPSPELKARLQRALERAHIDPGAVAPLKPWLVAALLALAEFSAQGYRAELAVDGHLAQLARANKVKVLELESAGAQLALFDRLSGAEQWRLLEEGIAAIESGKQHAQARQLALAWSTADQAALHAIAERAEQDTTVSGKFVQEVILGERNGPMADKLAQLLAREERTVAAIGVLHLLGRHSVPALLRARGMTVERVY